MIFMNAPAHGRGRTGQYFIILAFIFLLAFVVRLLFIPSPGFEADVAFWKSWGLAALDNGVVWSMHNTNNNYPTPFAYFLTGMVRVYGLFADPHDFYSFWDNTNLLFLTIAKMPAILADLAIAGIILFIGKHAKRFGFIQQPKTFWAILAVLYLFNPITIMDSAWWGQVDSVGVLIFLFSFLALLSRRPFLAGLIYMTAVMTKLQNMIYGPLYLIFIWQYLGVAGTVRAVAGMTVALVGLNIEFLLARDMGRVFESLTSNYDYFPLMSLNAYNLWWIAASAEGMKTSDKLLSVGIMNAKSVGLILFSGMYFLAALQLIAGTFMKMLSTSASWSKKIASRAITYVEEKKTENSFLLPLLISLIIAVFAFFLLQTESHERYAFPLTIFLLLVTPFLPKRTVKIWLAGYGIWSILYFYNLHSGFAANYPQNTIGILNALITPAFTIPASYLQIIVFLGYLLFFLRFIPLPVYGIAAIYIVGLLTLGNLDYMRNKPVPITKLKPFISGQDWGKRVEDMSVNAAYGPKSWNPLSVQYYFYRSGLGTHAISKHSYDVNGRFSKLTTDFGIDTESGPKASAVFQIWGDNRLLFESQKLGRYEAPRHIEVTIEGVKTMELVITDAGDGNQDDHADWLNTKLWK